MPPHTAPAAASASKESAGKHQTLILACSSCSGAGAAPALLLSADFDMCSACNLLCHYRPCFAHVSGLVMISAKALVPFYKGQSVQHIGARRHHHIDLISLRIVLYTTRILFSTDCTAHKSKSLPKVMLT